MFWTSSPLNGARQKNLPLLFSMCTPPRYTSRHSPISQRRRVSSAAEKALFSFLFFSSAPDDYIPVDAQQRDSSYVC